MRGAALYFAGQIEEISSYDGIIVSNMLSLSDLKAVLGSDIPPIILYFHENQILYPLSAGEKEDLHYGFTDITSALSADYILFNSEFHRRAFLRALNPFISRFPDKRPYWVIDKIEEKTQVLYPGCHIDKDNDAISDKSTFPLIIWNHRWEHDKNPEDFFNALFQLHDENIDFKLAVLGEEYKKSPEIFKIAREKLKKRIVHFGYAESYSEYRDWLLKGDIIISTALQENFGISVVEAIGSGNFPLLPDRLSYRELIPGNYHKLCLYKNQNDLIAKLKKIIIEYDWDIMDDIRLKNLRFSWENMKGKYDDYLNTVKKKSRN